MQYPITDKTVEEFTHQFNPSARSLHLIKIVQEFINEAYSFGVEEGLRLAHKGINSDDNSNHN